MFTEVKRGVAPQCDAQLRTQCKDCGPCYSPEGCCGSLSSSICIGDQCCDLCSFCSGCEACYPDDDTCNPVPTGGEIDIFDAGCNTAYDFTCRARSSPNHSSCWNDILVAHCIYNSMERTKFTPGGDETENEMCINF